jgi:hypothetical protein
LIISARTQVTDNERQYRLSLLETPSEEQSAKESKVTMRFIYGVALFGIGTAALMLYFYVAPFQRSMIEEGVSFKFDWFTGEALFAYAWAIVFVPLAYLLYRGVRKDYVSK